MLTLLTACLSRNLGKEVCLRYYKEVKLAAKASQIKWPHKHGQWMSSFTYMKMIIHVICKNVNFISKCYLQTLMQVLIEEHIGTLETEWVFFSSITFRQKILKENLVIILIPNGSKKILASWQSWTKK